MFCEFLKINHIELGTRLLDNKSQRMNQKDHLITWLTVFLLLFYFMHRIYMQCVISFMDEYRVIF